MSTANRPTSLVSGGSRGVNQGMWLLALAAGMLRNRRKRGTSQLIRTTDQAQPYCRQGRHDRQRRFDQREGHDLERLICTEMGSGVSTGLLECLTAVGRQIATVGAI